MGRTVIAAGLLVALCGAAVADPVDLTDDQVKAVEKAVKAVLKDPYSAVLSRPGAATTNLSLSLTVCGLWNAKNGMGGYNGQSVYMGQFWSHDQGKTYDPASFELIKIVEPGYESKSLLATCQDQGVVIPE